MPSSRCQLRVISDSCTAANSMAMIASSTSEQHRWNFQAECFGPLQVSRVLEWLVAVTAAFCSEHSPGPGLAWLVAVTAFCSEHSPGPGLAWWVPMAAAFCSEHSPGPGLAWLMAVTAAFCSEHSPGRSAARPSSGNTCCKLSIVPGAESLGTSRPRFPFAPQHKAFAHPVRTMLGGWFLLLHVSDRLWLALRVVWPDFERLHRRYLCEPVLPRSYSRTLSTTH